MKATFKYIFAVLIIVFLDQGSKLWVYNHMAIGTSHPIPIMPKFIKLTYVLNYGMAFSIQLGFKYGKLFITLIRIIASLYIVLHTISLHKHPEVKDSILGWICVLGGAIGNSIDSIFYGIYLKNAPLAAPMKWLHGQVIDMIHIDLWSGVLPDWVPIWGGYQVSCLPIFNIADVAILLGLLLICYKYTQQKKNLVCSVPM